MIDFLKSQLLLVVIGVGVVSGGTGWIVKDQLQGREVLLLETKLSDCELKVVEKNSDVVGDDARSKRSRMWQERIEEEMKNSSGMVPRGQGY